MTAGPSSEIKIFLFTDLVNSTQLWEKYPEAMKDALASHDRILRDAVERSNGRVVKTTGDGLNAVFNSAIDGLRACLDAQIKLAKGPWGETGALLVRMGLHLGEAQPRGGDYYGPAVNRAARLMAVAHGGQVLLSAAVANIVQNQLPDKVSLLDLHQHRLKDLEQPEHIYQLVHPELRTEFSPLQSLSQRPNNLPTQTSTFLGREIELAEVKDILTSFEVRLVTLLGPGGTGKTRLALQASAELIDSFDDGVYLVELASIHDPDSVLTTIGRTIGLPEAKEGPLLDALANQLQDKRILLLLDNFEQVIPAAVTIVDLLEACPQLKILVTSREALRVRGEHLYIVPPLEIPGPRIETLALEEVKQIESIQLFIQRAKTVRPDFSLTEENATIVAEICQRLDGLPLAIELAAARIRLFPPPALLTRLQKSLKLLRGGARDLPIRQQTLYDTIDWSYKLLDAAEKRLFALFSIFSGAPYEAVEKVYSVFENQGKEDLDVFDGLLSLIDKSLIQQQESGDGTPRLTMLGTIREYARERLDEDQELTKAVQRAHAQYYAAFSQDCWIRLSGTERDWALVALEIEFENLQISWRYWTEEQELEQLNKLVDSLWQLYDARGWYQATVEMTSDLLRVLSETPSSPERAQQEMTLYTGLARVLLATKGYTSQVEEAYRRALDLSEKAGEIPQQFPVLRGLYNFYLYRSELDKVGEIGKRILQLAETRDDDDMRVTGLYALGANTGFQDKLRQGVAGLDKALSYYDPGRRHSTRFRAGNDPAVISHTTAAFFLWSLGYPDSAQERADKGLELAQQLNHPLSLTYANYHSGYLHLWLREPLTVQERAQTVLELAGKHQFQIWIALGTCLHGAALAQLGQGQEGLALVRKGKALYQGLTTPPIFWPLLLQMEASACLQNGTAKEGVSIMKQLIANAPEYGGEAGGRWLLGETMTLMGDLLLGQSRTNRIEAATHYQQAITISESLGARMPQLRAAMRFSGLLQEQGKQQKAYQLLSDVYETFSEGLGRVDLIEAKALLDNLSTAMD